MLHDLVTVFGPAREAVLTRELTKVHETIRLARLDDLLHWVESDENQRRGEFVVLVAGAEAGADTQPLDVDRLLSILLEELPLKQAAALAARISGDKKNALYRRALTLSER